jgi:hypothetical protein
LSDALNGTGMLHPTLYGVTSGTNSVTSNILSSVINLNDGDPSKA